MIKIRKKKTKTKPASEAQKRARERNWNKGQIKCMSAIANKIYNSKTTRLDEKLALNTIIYALGKILHNWTK